MRENSKKIKYGSLIIFKDNKLNITSYQGFTLNQYQVFLTLISKLQAYHSYNKSMTNFHVALEASEFKREFQIIGNVAYNILQASVDHLLKTQLLVPEEDLKKYTKINICSKARYIAREGRVEVKFTDDIFPYLTKAKKQFTSYKLNDISHFRSVYTTRLYELIMQYKKTGWVLVTIDALRKVFSASEKFSRYFDFKKKTFSHACVEINKIHKDLKLEFLEIKEGKKVEKIRFNFTPQSKQSLQKTSLEQLSSNEEEKLISDDELVQTTFPDMSQIKEVMPTKNFTKKVKTLPQTNFFQRNSKNKPQKSIWQKMVSFLS